MKSKTLFSMRFVVINDMSVPTIEALTTVISMFRRYSYISTPSVFFTPSVLFLPNLFKVVGSNRVVRKTKWLAENGSKTRKETSS